MRYTKADLLAWAKAHGRLTQGVKGVKIHLWTKILLLPKSSGRACGN